VICAHRIPTWLATAADAAGRGIVRAALPAVVLALSACSQSGDTVPVSQMRRDIARSEFQASAGSDPADAAAPAKRQAVSHSFVLRVPSVELEALQRRHLTECARLGCTVLTTNLDRSLDWRITAKISVRISPEAFAAFAEFIAAPPAVVVGHTETVEDKTIPFLDVEKRLELKSALRARLVAMLQDPASKSATDLAAIEKELAQVQGDIEAAIAQRDYLRTITETARVDISYVGLAAQAAGIDLSPIRHAVTGVGQTVVASVATLISFIAALVPWLPLLGLLGWGAPRVWRRWKARRAAI
jgi:hypothetical protein